MATNGSPCRVALQQRGVSCGIAGRFHDGLSTHSTVFAQSFETSFIFLPLDGDGHGLVGEEHAAVAAASMTPTCAAG